LHTHQKDNQNTIETEEEQKDHPIFDRDAVSTNKKDF
jgi:hypothetical protein